MESLAWTAMASDRLVLEHTELNLEDFSGSKLTSLTVVECRLSHCHFDRATIKQACFGAGSRISEYSDCSFNRSRIRALAPGNARFVRCSFRDILIRDLFAVSLEFIDCTFTGRIEKAAFFGAIPKEDHTAVGRTRNEFRGNDLRHVELVDVAFRGGINLDEQRLPEGSQYLYVADAEAAVERVRNEIIAWTDLDQRSLALALIRVLERTVQGGQRQLLLRRDDFPRGGATDAVFLALASAEAGTEGDVRS